MTEETPADAVSFDLGRLRELFEMMEKHGLTEVDLRNGPERWRLRRGPGEWAMPQPIAPIGYAPQPVQPPAPAPAVAQTPAASAPAAESAPTGLVIKSPTVGTFYTASTPDDPPFVSVGSTVKPDTIVCIVEAMKVFNQIPAEISGTITAVLVKNGDAVEYGQPLFRVNPA